MPNAAGVNTGSCPACTAVLRHADIGRLLVGHLGELDADLGEVQPRDLLVEVLGQRVDLLLVFLRVGPQFDLRQRLVGERRRHHEARMPHGVAEIYQPAFRQQDDALAVGKFDLVDLRLDVHPLHVAQARNLDLAVEVADVADDGAVLHLAHVLDGDDVEIAGRGAEDVGARCGILHRGDLVAFHRGLQRADRIDLRHHHAAAGLAQRRRRALADVAEARDHRDLAGHHHVGAAADAVDQRFTAAVEVVELRFGHAVVDVDRRPKELALLLHLVEPVHAGGGLLGHAADVLGVLLVEAGLVLDPLLDGGKQHFLFLVGRLGDRGSSRRLRRARRDE